MVIGNQSSWSISPPTQTLTHTVTVPWEVMGRNTFLVCHILITITMVPVCSPSATVWIQQVTVRVNMNDAMWRSTVAAAAARKL
mmetsp:Transcript_119760/g.298768  ORF Transcript_119760/g.298768 Transcript_119760/m.298768 type:complete len:84 (+) Transcript_119760:491-742(+)